MVMYDYNPSPSRQFSIIPIKQYNAEYYSSLLFKENLEANLSYFRDLWKNVCQPLSSAMQATPDILRQYELFVQLHQQLTDWLASFEKSLSRDLEESFLSSADDKEDTCSGFMLETSRVTRLCSHG